MTCDEIMHDLGNALCGVEGDVRRIKSVGGRLTPLEREAINRLGLRLARLEELRLKLERGE